MKKLFFGIFVLALSVVGLSSCKKSLSEQIVGNYHFKMSGNFDCRCESDTSTFIMNPLTGQMRIIKGDEDRYFVNMSVLLVGDLVSFNAVLRNDTLVLEKTDVSINVTKEGTSALFTTPVKLMLSGKGKKFSDTIMMNMTADGVFEYVEDLKKIKCEILPQTGGIVCEAYKN